jgi:hypothetical protein
MPASQTDLYKSKARLLQKAKRKKGIVIPLKDAFALIAKTAGFASWREMKAALETSALFCPPGTSAHWKNWHARYEDALVLLPKGDYFLLPYQKHFFLCESHYIRALGIDPEGADARLVGRDWTRPANKAAWARIVKKIGGEAR